jgi:hypothetical protein
VRVLFAGSSGLALGEVPRAATGVCNDSNQDRPVREPGRYKADQSHQPAARAAPGGRAAPTARLVVVLVAAGLFAGAADHDPLGFHDHGQGPVARPVLGIDGIVLDRRIEP